MRQKSFFYYMVLTFFGTLGLSSLIVVMYAIYDFHRIDEKHTIEELTNKTYLFKTGYELLSHEKIGFDSVARKLDTLTNTRYTIVSRNGSVILDSRNDFLKMENHLDRPEIITALNGKVGKAIRYSTTVGRQFLYIALPVFTNDTIYSVVRASVPLLTTYERIRKFSVDILIFSICIGLLALIVSILLSRMISRPIEELRSMADNFIKTYEVPQIIPKTSIIELNTLCTTFIHMAQQLSERIKLVSDQNNEREAIFAAMIEGVVAIDTQEHIIHINKAAGKILDIDVSLSQNKLIHEAIRNSIIIEFIQKVLQEKSAATEQIRTFNESEKLVQISATIIKGSQQNQITGVLLVLHDITTLKKLETMRKDFVANVSHELRTPLTLIKGFVETLVDGAMNDPFEAKRFLSIIDTHVNRLNTLIDDLLMLSSIEKERETKSIEFTLSPVSESIRDAVVYCQTKAQQKSISIIQNLNDAAYCFINKSLFVQALINLLDNAINYSNPSTTITISCTNEHGYSIIAVADQGIGIAAEHINRIFERFYRVDKARSKKAGGTGLGLAIVKHIVQLHKATITVKSTLAEGSVFQIRMPTAKQESLNHGQQ